MRIGRFAQDAQRKVQEAAEEMEARYSANLQTLLRQGLGIEVAPGSLLTGSLEDHSITVRPPGPTEPTDDA